jgi:hypothetical protein
MSFTYVGQAITKASTFAAGSAFDLPAGTADGDLLTIAVNTTGNYLITLPAGWTTRYAVNKNNEGGLISNIVRGYVVRGASAPGDILAGFTGTMRVGIVVKAYRPTSGVATFVDEAIGDMSGAFGTSHSWTGVSDLETDDLLDMALSSGRNITWGNADAVTDPSTASGAGTTTGMPTAGAWLAREADNSPTATLAWFSACGVKSSAGATGDFLMTTDINAGPLGSVMVFRDVAGGSSGPTIGTQPTDETVTEGDPAVFTVAATGTGTLTYQWQEDDGGGFADITDGGAYSGATTDELTIDPTTLGLDGYLYRCNVTDDDSTTASDSAELTVTAAPLGFSVTVRNPADGTTRNSYTFDKVYAVRLSDNALVKTWTGPSTNGSGVLTLSDAALTAAPHAIVTIETTGTPDTAGAEIVTPA